MMTVKTSMGNETISINKIHANGKSTVKILSIKNITYDVLVFRTRRPEQFIFSPGQATEISINKEGWKDKRNPFTITSLPRDSYLEFTIKTYPTHAGVTNEMLNLKADDELILHEVFGKIAYKGEGVFIAGGAGITPFISIFRYLRANNKTGMNKLIFANKTREDIIHEFEFKELLGSNFINILSEETTDEYESGTITEEFLKEHCGGIDKMFYLCGPPKMMEAVEKMLHNMHVEEKSIVKEIF